MSAKLLRQNATAAERVFWAELRGNRLGGLSFRRQHPIGAFVVDFACSSRLLVVELDGDIHAGQRLQDRARIANLEGYGWQIIRFENREIESNLPHVLETILGVAMNRPLAPGQRGSTRSSTALPSPNVGGGVGGGGS